MKSILSRDVGISSVSCSAVMVVGTAVLCWFLAATEWIVRRFFALSGLVFQAGKADEFVVAAAGTTENSAQKMSKKGSSPLPTSGIPAKHPRQTTPTLAPILTAETVALFAVPAFCTAVASALGVKTVKKAGITLNYIVRGLTPAMTCLYGFLVHGERVSISTTLLLLLTFLGTSLAGWGVGGEATETDEKASLEAFLWLFLGCAMVVGVNVTTKEAQMAVKERGLEREIDQRQQWSTLVTLAAAWTVVLSVATGGHAFAEVFGAIGLSLGPDSAGAFVGEDSFSSRSANQDLSNVLGGVVPMFILLAASWFMENILTFNLVSKMSPLSYAMLRVLNRVAVIVTDQLLFKQDMAFGNCAGLVLATAGCIGYD